MYFCSHKDTWLYAHCLATRTGDILSLPLVPPTASKEKKQKTKNPRNNSVAGNLEIQTEGLSLPLREPSPLH